MRTQKENDMERITIARTILGITPSIDSYCNVVKRKNYYRAINSFNSSEDTYSVMEKIIEKAYQAQQLHNIQVKVYRYLNTLPIKLGRIVEFYFLKNKDPFKIMAELNVSRRTVFRAIEQEIQCFADNLDKLGINPLIFRQLLQQHRWIRTEYQRQKKVS